MGRGPVQVVHDGAHQDHPYPDIHPVWFLVLIDIRRAFSAIVAAQPDLRQAKDVPEEEERNEQNLHGVLILHERNEIGGDADEEVELA